MHAAINGEGVSAAYLATLSEYLPAVAAGGDGGSLDKTIDLRPTSRGGDDELLPSHYAESFFGRDFARRMMRAAGLCDASGAPPAYITRTAFWMLCLSGINEANDENHGCTPKPMPKSSWALVFSSVNQMETIGEGLRRFAGLVPVIPSGLSVSIGYSAAGVKVNYGVADGAADIERAERYADLMALVFHCVLLWVTSRPLRPLCVGLSERLTDRDGSMAGILSPYRSRSGLGTTVTYHRDDMHVPLGVRRYKHWASHETSMFLELVGNAGSIDAGEAGGPAAVINRLRQKLAQDNASQQQVARELGMSVATLQRRLADAGYSFRDISREVRMGKLQSLLATDSSLDDIAVELGFSERRSLWRACQDWLGMSPASYRRKLREQQDPLVPGLHTAMCGMAAGD